MTHETVHDVIQKLKEKYIPISIPKLKILSNKKIKSFKEDSDHSWITSQNASFEGITGGPQFHFSNIQIVTSLTIDETGVKFTGISAAGAGRSNAEGFIADHFKYFAHVFKAIDKFSALVVKKLTTYVLSLDYTLLIHPSIEFCL
ncbi:hypothetical protein B4U80_14214 [Leptotrombidium deliense]|uniref:Uncharacterized protein n=1 Tax=Leptotrombidium deliense TaxID=299467 RepID=A0A443RZZ7_9ACAR|nr:hypothetical protein B4U80_14214 [Leptotrombidium deliense]